MKCCIVASIIRARKNFMHSVNFRYKGSGINILTIVVFLFLAVPVLGETLYSSTDTV